MACAVGSMRFASRGPSTCHAFSLPQSRGYEEPRVSQSPASGSIVWIRIGDCHPSGSHSDRLPLARLNRNTPHTGGEPPTPRPLPRRAHECSFLAIVWHVTIRRARLPPRYIRPKTRSKFAPPGPKRRSYWAWCVFSALSPRSAAESSLFSSEVRILPWFNTQSPRFARRKLIS